MPRFHQHCVACAWVDTILAQPFENPACPVCGGQTERLWVGASAAVRDDTYVGGKTFQNYGPKPVTFYSESERKRYMKQHGLEEVARFAPVPGSDKDRFGNVRWDAYPDPVTLENARVLAGRQGRGAKEPTDAPVETLRWLPVRDAGTFRVRGE